MEVVRSQRNLSHQARTKPCRIIIGASGTAQPGWITTEKVYLDLLKPKDWSKCFDPESIDAILAEHVWEHLTKSNGILAAENCYRYLRKSGYLRIAVPDGFSTIPGYIDCVKPGGVGAGADDHKVLYNYKTLSDLLAQIGYKVKPLEYFDEKGTFHCKKWTPKDGKIYRSKRFDARNQKGVINYTSLIIDAFK
jgi:predicted SAM-dependent methyltransferase